jgi:hypothetical protein
LRNDGGHDFSTRYKFGRFPDLQVQNATGKGNVQRVSGWPQVRRAEELLLVFEFRCETKCTRKRKPRATKRMEFAPLIKVIGTRI